MNTISSYNIKVKHLTSTRTGEAVKNQFIIEFGNLICFQSYNSLIAIYNKEDNSLTLGKHFDYSVTTSKYLKQFICEYLPLTILDLIPFEKYSTTKALNIAINNGVIIYDENMV